MTESQYLLPSQDLHFKFSTLKNVMSFVFLDIILIGLLWFIFVMTNRSTVTFKSEIIRYSFQTSLFDFVCLSVVRGVIISLWFLNIHRHRVTMLITLALGTTLMIIFKILKYFMFAEYDEKYRQSLSFAIPILLLSFSLSWLHLWKLSYTVNWKIEPYPTYGTFENAEKVRDWLDASEIESFYTARTKRGHERKGSCEIPNPDWVVEKKIMWEVVLPLYVSDSDWKVHSDDGQAMVLVHDHPDLGHLICGKTTIYAPFNDIARELIDNAEANTQWDSQTERISRNVISDDSDIVVAVTKDAAGGLVKSRVFSTFRAWKFDTIADISTCVLCSVSVNPDQSLPTDIQIGLINYGTGFYLISSANSPTSEISVYFNLDLNMSIPNFIKNKEMAKAAYKYVLALKHYMESK